MFITAGFGVYDGPIAPTAEHRHHAVQVVIAVDPGVLLRAAHRQVRACLAVVPPDAPHAIAQACARATIVYIEPESPAGRELMREGAREGTRFDPSGWVRAPGSLNGVAPIALEDWPQVLALIGRLGSGHLCSGRPHRPYPPPIERLIDALPQELDEPIRLRAMATRLGISQSRLSHLVAAHIGIPFRRYVLWLRLRASAVALARGGTVTQAAHAAGFADAAHMNRTFRRMLGVVPTDVSRTLKWHVL